MEDRGWSGIRIRNCKLKIASSGDHFTISFCNLHFSICNLQFPIFSADVLVPAGAAACVHTANIVRQRLCFRNFANRSL